MKPIVLLLALILGVTSCNSEKKRNHFIISGNVFEDSLNNKEIILLTETKEITDTTIIKSNKFKFHGMVSVPTRAGLFVEDYIIQFPLINDKIFIKIKNKDNYDFHYSQSHIYENIQSYYDKESKDYIDEYKRYIEQELKSLTDSLKYAAINAQDSLSINFINYLIEKYKSLSDKSGLSIIVDDLTGLIGTRNHPQQIEEIFNIVPENEKNGYYGKNITTYLKRSEKIAIGQKIDFDFKDINGIPYSLHDFQGKLILLDFWASWCGPCIAQVPILKQISKDSSKIIIISISIDKELTKFKKKVNELNMDWINIHYKQKNIDLKKNFFINGVPYNILVSPEGEIVRKNISLSELQELLNK